MLTIRKSRFFNFFKRRSKRDTRGSKSSSEEFHSFPTTPTSPTHPTTPPRLISPTTPVDVEPEDQRDGFYKYGESFGESPLSSFLSSYQVLKDNGLEQRDSGYFNMTARKRHSRPYTVSSDEWVGHRSSSSSSSSASRTGVVFSMHDMTDVQRAVHFGAVLKIFIKIFTMAKILHVAFLAYGVHLDHSETGLLFWIKRAEAEIRTDSLGTLIEIVENLYYVLYSRLVLELANIELSSLFEITTRPWTAYHEFVLPASDHLYRILVAFKDILDAPSMCEAIRTDLVTYYQESYIHRMATHDSVKEDVLDDILGFRRYAVSVISDKNSAYFVKWNSLIPFFDSISPKLLAILAEKYLTHTPKFLLEYDIPLSKLPFAYNRKLDLAAWERERQFDHRIATLAKLEGRVVGEERRDDYRLGLLTLVKQEKCICISICSCALACTYDVERPCPCSERHLRIMLARRRQDTGTSDFMTRANTLGRAFFEGLAVLNPDTKARHLSTELRFAFENFQLEIQKERAIVPVCVWT